MWNLEGTIVELGQISEIMGIDVGWNWKGIQLGMVLGSGSKLKYFLITTAKKDLDKV